MTPHDKKSFAASPEWLLPHDCPHTLDELASNYAGFIYIIKAPCGRSYVGKKSLTAKGWRSYYGSSKELCADIRATGEQHYQREIISLHHSAQELAYAEVCELFARDVLNARLPDGRHAYYNRAIVAGRYFRAKDARP